MVQGKRVRLEFDEGNAHIGHRDKYRRTLAYVFLEDGTFLNAEIIKRGYGFAYTRFPFKYLEEFRRYQREAREQGKGLWEKSAVSPPTRKSDQAATSDITKATRRPFFVIGLWRGNRTEGYGARGLRLPLDFFNSFSIQEQRSSARNGLPMKSSQPLWRHSSLSLRVVIAVTARIGMEWVFGC